MYISKRAELKIVYRVIYNWNMHSLMHQFPEIGEWFNQYIMENAKYLDGTEMGELFDISDLQWTKEEAEHIKIQLDRLNIPSRIVPEPQHDIDEE